MPSILKGVLYILLEMVSYHDLVVVAFLAKAWWLPIANSFSIKCDLGV